MILKSHLLSMILYSGFVGTVLALLRRKERKAQVKYGLYLFLIMIVGSILFGWFMTLFF